MLYHNLKISWRNLMKYKLQTTISVLSIAVGIVVLAAVHSIVQRQFRPAQITNMPYYDRVCELRFPTPIDGTISERFNVDMVRALKSGGEMQNVEFGPTFQTDIYRGNELSFVLGDTLTRKFHIQYILSEASFPHFLGFTSAITGKRIAALKPNEAVLPKSVAKKIFGEVNPVGAYVEIHETSLIVVDVYDDLSQSDYGFENTLIYTLNKELFMQELERNKYVCHNIYYILKEGCTPEQLEEESNMRLAPLGYKVKAELTKEVSAEVNAELSDIRIFFYLFGTLILVVAIIGFLRIQTQLFWMRKREMSLRMVNGAKRHQLFVLLMTEVLIVVLASVGMALLMGNWLERFINTLYTKIEEDGTILVDNLLSYSAVVGGALLIICAVIVWMVLTRICKNSQGLAANMRGSRNHAFRNIMLWLQVTVGMLFVSVAVVLAVICNRMSDEYVLPDDDKPYRESILIEKRHAENRERLYEELSALPDVAQVIPFDEAYSSYRETDMCDSLSKYFRDDYFKTFFSRDTALIDFLDVQTKWFRPELKGEACVLINEETYRLLEKYGVLANGILTITNWYDTLSLEIAGTFKEVVFSKKDIDPRVNFIAINPLWSNIKVFEKYLLVPRQGRYHALMSDVESTVARVEPTVVNQMIFNFYERQNLAVEIMLTVRKGGLILGCVSLLICIMSIYSTIALDTRARRKEVAIRKINGAKAKDIALLFTRLYMVLTLCALLVIIPLALNLQVLCNTNNNPKDMFYGLPIVACALTGCLVVILSIALIVGWQVWGIMRINPAEILAKE